MDNELVKKQQAKAIEYKIAKAIGKLKMQWSLKEDKHCLHNDWYALAKAVGLGTSEIPALKVWVSANGRKPPIRIDGKE